MPDTGTVKRHDTVSALERAHSLDRQMIPSICCAKCHGGMQPGRLGRVLPSNEPEAGGWDAAPGRGLQRGGLKGLPNALNGGSLLCWECQVSILNPGYGAGGGWIWDRHLIFQGIPATVSSEMGRGSVRILSLWTMWIEEGPCLCSMFGNAPATPPWRAL